MEDKIADLRHWIGVMENAANRARLTDPQRACAISKAEDVLIRRYLLSKEPPTRNPLGG